MARKQFSVNSDPMLLYFISVLEVRIVVFLNAGGLTTAQNDLLTVVKTRLEQLKAAGAGTIAEDTAWTEAYSLERLMATLEPQGTLFDEVRRRVDEAAAEGVAAEPRLRVALTVAERTCFDTSKTPPEFKPSEAPTLRSLLNETLEETHWTMQRKYAIRPFQKTATGKIVVVGVVSFLLLLAPYILLYAVIIRGSHVDLGTWAWLPFYTALTAGLFGAFFSRLQFLQSNSGAMSLGEMKNAAEWSSILLRGSVGICGAMVVFFLLQSGLVSSPLIPKSGDMGISRFLVPVAEVKNGATPATLLELPSQALCLLIVWCLIAGLSERLVPSILTSTEEQLAAASKGAKK